MPEVVSVYRKRCPYAGRGVRMPERVSVYRKGCPYAGRGVRMPNGVRIQGGANLQQGQHRGGEGTVQLSVLADEQEEQGFWTPFFDYFRSGPTLREGRGCGGGSRIPVCKASCLIQMSQHG